MRRTLLGIFAMALAIGATAQAERSYRGRTLPDSMPPARLGTTNISDINANTAQGLSPLEFFPVTIEGIAQVGTGEIDPIDQSAPSTWIYVADATGGIAISHPSQIGTPVARGDRVSVSSTVFTQGVIPLRGTRTLDLGFGGTITVIGSGAVTPPTVATAADIETNGAAFEGSRVRVGGLTLVDVGQWPGEGASGFVDATDGTNTFRIYVDEDTNLDELTRIPAGNLSVIGFVAQDDPAAGFPALHYVYATGAADVIPGLGQGTVSLDPATVFQGAAGQTLTFTVTGQEATLDTIEFVIPADWAWTNPSDVTLSGLGFNGATFTTRPEGATTVVVVSGASVSPTASGTAAIGSLTVPSSVGDASFVTRTAAAAQTPTDVLLSPSVEILIVVAPGDVVINEVFGVTIPVSEGREPAEFIELFNRTTAPIDIGGWALADIGKTPNCTLDGAWRFPTGTIIDGNGYLVVCQTGAGFRTRFPAFPGGVPLLEMYDDETPAGDDTDDPSITNLILETPTPANDQILLLGGSVISTNVGQCELPDVPGQFIPFAELVTLKSTDGQFVDVIEYQELGPCTGDFCRDGVTGPDDAYRFGVPKFDHTLGRDASSTDTNVSGVDLIPSSTPTPGAVNVPGDTVPPAVVTSEALSGVVLEILFDEPVVDALALNPGNYRVTLAPTGQAVAVLDVLADPQLPARHYFLVVEAVAGGSSLDVAFSGITDLVVNGTGGNEISAVETFNVPATARAVCEIQEFDETGFSPAVGDTVVITGFVTLGSIPPVAAGELPPTDRVSIWVQEPGGCGVNVFTFLGDDPADYMTVFQDIQQNGVRINDLVQIRGSVTEFVSGTSGSGAVTEVAGFDGDSAFYRFLLRGLEGPTPIEVTTREASDEALEGTLIHTQGTVINSNSLAAYIDDGSGSIQVFQNFGSIDLTQFTVGDRLDVTGVLTQFDSTAPYFSGYELVPQNQEAIFKVDGGNSLDGPFVSIDRRVLVPERGEKIRIVTQSPRRSDVIIEIYDMVGRKIDTLYDGIGLGYQHFDWDGSDQNGSQVAPGVYICHMRAVALDGGSVNASSAPIVVGLRLNGAGGAR